ncbi:fructose-2,6-bisphosphatase TIGAR-like [Pocillopora verrucosa]|uniref:fructose-2,6-bisphosphatase TIGAR-like n=1 Tax=Pocillopora verrucosa TaxID=203993 RepID=UPI002796FDAD|nr:fructose-2,6-bisphosphatase TIGAR-like [Pocillopora verrucosa]
MADATDAGDSCSAFILLTLVRHGETPENKANIIQGQTDTLLSDEGIKQAQLAGNKLNDEVFSHIYSSDLKRARKTAEEIINQNNCCSQMKIVEDSRLRERGYGVAEGVSNQRFKQMAAENNMKTNIFTPKGGETVAELKERAAKFLNSIIHEIGTSHCSDSSSSIQNDICVNDRIIDEPQTSKCVTQKQEKMSQLANILAVSHGGLIRQLLLHCMDDLPSKFPPGSKRRISFTSPNTGLSKLKIYLKKETKLPEFVECFYLYNAEHLS